MRIFNRVNIIWFLFLSLGTVAACLLYVSTFHPQRVPVGVRFPQLSGDTPGYINVGATPLGLIFGSIAFGIFIFAGLLGLRKKIVLWRIGTVQLWLRAHVWLTLLTIPLVILHTGFRLGGPMTTLLVTLYAIVMGSGIYGLTLQHYLPRMMNERLSTETVSEQIPFIRVQLCQAAEKMRIRFAPIEAAKTTGRSMHSFTPAGDPTSTPPPLVTSAPLESGDLHYLGQDWYLDINARYTLWREVTPGAKAPAESYVEVGSINLLNRHAAFSTYQFSTLGYDPAEADIRGRVLYAGFGLRW